MPTDEDRELIVPSEVGLWNELTDMILEWEDGEGDDTAGGLARRIVAIFRRESESLLADRAKLQEALQKISIGEVGGSDPFESYMLVRKLALDAINRSTDHTP